MAKKKTHRAPAPLLCRSPSTFRSCLTYFKNLQTDGILDFSKLHFVDPGALVLLHHVARAHKKYQIVVVPPEREETRSYMMDHLGPRGKLRNPNKYPLRYVAREQDLALELGKWREMLQASQALDEERAREFSSTMSEVLMNSFVHGQTKEPCIVAGQTFPKMGHSALAAVDIGKSIPQTLIASKRYPGERTDEQWILHSLERGVTSKTRVTNMGFGLTVLANMIRRNKGSMLLASGTGIVTIESGGEPTAQPLGSRYQSFPGTFLMLDIPTTGAS